mmetsp:Transcript_29753/g.95358  ORF Transcript_29753/g.95358 Transcript_29753/m.95358 type:complete len:417 (+) Transcript_29753:866-2116(+)
MFLFCTRARCAFMGRRLCLRSTSRPRVSFALPIIIRLTTSCSPWAGCRGIPAGRSKTGGLGASLLRICARAYRCAMYQGLSLTIPKTVRNQNQTRLRRGLSELKQQSAAEVFFGQLGALMARDRRMVCRQLDQHITTHITMLVVALVYGWFFFKNGIKEESMNFLPNCLPDHYQPAACGAYFAAHMSVISLVSINMMFTSLGIAIDIIHRERPVLLRECAGGYYGIVAFFLSKCVFEVVLMSCSTAVTLLGTYFLVRLRGNMFILFCEIMLMSFASSSLMYLLSAASRTREQAQTLALLPQVLQFAFSGLLVPAQMVPASLQWLKWCCPLFYGMGLVSVTEFQYVFDATHKCKADFGAEWATITNCTSWSQRTEMLGYHDVHEGDWKNDLMMLCVLSVVLRFFAVLFLARNTKFAV